MLPRRKLTVMFACVLLCACTVRPTEGALPSTTTSTVNGKIAFAREPDSEGALYTVNPDGSDLVQVGTGENLRFSPDGTRLLFACPSGGGDHVAVCTVNADGNDLTHVVPKTNDMADPPSDFYPTAWSPDGRMILVDAGAGITSTNAGILTMRADGTHLTRVTSTPSEQIPWSFSPDGSRILFLDGTDLFVVNVDGTGLTHVNPTRLGLDCCMPPRAVWSPDGLRIAFTASSGDAGGGSGSALFTARPNGTGLQQLTASGAHAALPKWSPDGRWIAFEAEAGQGSSGIAIVHPDGSDRHFVTSPSDGVALRPVWSPDGTSLLMTYVGYDIWTVNVDGTGLARLTNSPAFDEAADWGVSPRQPDG